MTHLKIITNAKDRGRIRFSYNGLCQACGLRPARQIHHKFEQRKYAKKLYGDLIHHEKNRQYVCDECGTSHAGLGLIFWCEQEFCQALGIVERSETARRRKQREANLI
jgi:hypothetical protein